MTMLRTTVALVLAGSSVAPAQEAAIVYRLGRDTVAVEQFNRTAARLTGELVTRSGPAVTRLQYDFTLGADGRAVSAVVRRRQADGSPLPNTPQEYRFTFGADSATRTLVFADSSPSRAFAARRAYLSVPVFAYAPLELLNAAAYRGSRDSVQAIGLGGNAVTTIGLRPAGGDTLQLRGSVYPMLMRFDRDGRLQSVDGSLTTNKVLGTRVNGRVDINAIASAMRPTGVLSPRATAYAGFNQGPIFINYGRPAVRERSVWGGLLVPFDTIWRVGANEAAHLATSKTIAIGDMTLAPGLYTLWIQHTRTGTFLIVNRQVGQWGTVYQPAQDIGRAQMEFAATPEHVEDFTITIRPTGAGRGAIDFAWGPSMATAAFTVRQ
ncbi:MAG TPA: DUF2911 domain-containing protein [Gemmatimonadaceae bacterium]|nr:DUF2911 domain-containing protein [Gemmatimonadaceae bacterium]